LLRFEKKSVQADNEPKLESAEADTQAAPAPAATPVALDVRRTLTRLLRKRVKKFIELAPQVRADASPKTIHDMRVWSRRLQQAVSAFFPKPRSGKVRRLRRTPRQIRRALGEWRNCDVLLEIVARQQRHTRSDDKRRAWEFVRNYLLQKRAKEVARAGKKLLRQDAADYAALAQKLLTQPADENPQVIKQRLSDSVEEAWSDWQAALSRALETRAVSDLHGFRIATKVLRYRTELIDNLGYAELKADLKWLAELQDAIGVWHDRQVLYQAVAKAIARKQVLLDELATARILLAELQSDRKHEAVDVEKIFRLASERPTHPPLTPNALPLTEKVRSKGLGVK
jgi:CHAD domain-containing protein